MLNFCGWRSGIPFLVLQSAILAVALAIGLFIGIFQAATSINEMTLSFVPKVMLVMITFGFVANYMMVQLHDYFIYIFEQVRQVG